MVGIHSKLGCNAADYFESDGFTPGGQEWDDLEVSCTNSAPGHKATYIKKAGAQSPSGGVSFYSFDSQEIRAWHNGVTPDFPKKSIQTNYYGDDVPKRR